MDTLTGGIAQSGGSDRVFNPKGGALMPESRKWFYRSNATNYFKPQSCHSSIAR
jgi:hypothetical protein